MIGKLKHSLKEKCPDCGKILQLRVVKRKMLFKGVEVETPHELICCSKCSYTRGVKQKHRKPTQKDIELG